MKNNVKNIIPVIVFVVLSYTGYKDFSSDGLPDQITHQTMTELGLLNLKNSGVVWYGCYSYFNDNPVTDLMYKTRDCKLVVSRGKFYPGHNKYDYMKDTVKYIVGNLFKPSVSELDWLKRNYEPKTFKNVTIWRKNK